MFVLTVGELAHSVGGVFSSQVERERQLFRLAVLTEVLGGMY